jgi:cell division protein FtsX
MSVALGLGLIESSALYFYLVFPLTRLLYNAAEGIRLVGFDDLECLFIVLVLSQIGIFVGLFLALWIAK